MPDGVALALALLALAGTLAAAVVHSRWPIEAIVAAGCAALLVAIGAVSASHAVDALGDLDRTVGFLAAVLVEARAPMGRDATTERRRGRVEHEVVAAADGTDLLVLARDGDHARLGPHSLGPRARFVVDHAPCRVLLIWPDMPPPLTTIPPPP